MDVVGAYPRDFGDPQRVGAELRRPTVILRIYSLVLQSAGSDGVRGAQATFQPNTAPHDATVHFLASTLSRMLGALSWLCEAEPSCGAVWSGGHE